ncbi:1750_t:CDS:1, partial [Entrophospora sp. SA101]
MDIEKAFEAFKKWTITWTHLPLCVCSLGGESGPKFSQAVSHIVLSCPLPDEPTIRLKNYVE